MITLDDARAALRKACEPPGDPAIQALEWAPKYLAENAGSFEPEAFGWLVSFLTTQSLRIVRENCPQKDADMLERRLRTELEEVMDATNHEDELVKTNLRTLRKFLKKFRVTSGTPAGDHFAAVEMGLIARITTNDMEREG